MRRALPARYITHVAIKRNGALYYLPKPNRHHHIFYIMPDRDENTDEQGFVDNEGKFLSREDAFVVASNAGQLKPRPANGYNGPMLFSEDLW